MVEQSLHQQGIDLEIARLTTVRSITELAPDLVERAAWRQTTLPERTADAHQAILIASDPRFADYTVATYTEVYAAGLYKNRRTGIGATAMNGARLI